MTREELIESLRILKEQARDYGDNTFIQIINIDSFNSLINSAIEVLDQESKIKVLDRDEAIRKLGAVDVYKASAWITLLKDLEYLGLKICEVEE